MHRQTSFSRRTLLQRSAAAGAGLASGLATVRLTGLPGVAAQEAVTIAWWDQFLPLETYHRSIWEAYQQANPGVTVEYTVYNPQEMGQALQLAYESQQMPDVHSLAGLGVPAEQLVNAGWFQSLSNGHAIQAALPEGSLLDGFTIFDSQVYSFPLFTFRQYTTLNWYNKGLMEQAGLDPETGPRTWDEFRNAARSITEAGGGRLFGWIQGLSFTERMGIHAEELAQAAGAAGPIDHTTGEYAYATEPFAQAIEFLVSLQAEGSLFPASSTLDARTARARWATGVAGMFLDGPWNVGVVQTEFADFIEQVGVAPIPTPEGQTSFIHKPPTGGVFWVSSQSQNPDVAADILAGFTTPEYYVGLAEQMDQPPLDLTVVAQANVHPTYLQAVQSFDERVRLAPSPIVRNPVVAQVNAEMQDIHPNLGEITQGAFSGDVTDVRAALKQYNDALSAERERALGVVQQAGGQVSLDDWVFADWDPAEDFTAEMYGAATPTA